jgi:hypothetical protein
MSSLVIDEAGHLRKDIYFKFAINSFLEDLLNLRDYFEKGLLASQVFSLSLGLLSLFSADCSKIK